MKQWPATLQDVEEVYENNEAGSGGFFPVGVNNQWHSGIHLYTREQVSPMIQGELVAYRIGEEMVEVPKSQEITTIQYNNLKPEEKNYYRLNMGNTIKKMMGIFELKDVSDPPKDFYSDNFVLLKHSMTLPNSGIKETEFFTLYTNMEPYRQENAPRDFSPIPPKNQLLRFFYEYWTFKIDQDYVPEIDYYSYKGQSKQTIFPGAHCNIPEDQNYHEPHQKKEYSVQFLNEPGQNIPVLAEDIEIIDTVTLIPLREGISVYLKDADSKNLKKNKIAELLKEPGSDITLAHNPFGEEHWTRREGYIPVNLNRKCIVEEPVLKGWILINRFNKHGTYNIYTMKSGEELYALYNIREIAPDSGFYKIARLKDYLKTVRGLDTIHSGCITNREGEWVTSIDLSSQEGEEITPGEDLFCLVLESDKQPFNPDRDQHISYAFYTENKKRITPLRAADKLFENIPSQDNPQVKAVELSKQHHFEYIKTDRPTDRFIPETEENISGIQEEFFFVNYYITESWDTTRLVKASDFTYGNILGKGCMKMILISAFPLGGKSCI